MKIFGIGANKTGTTSLTKAFQILGFKASHWVHHREMAQKLILGQFDFPFLKEHDAVSDLPIPCIYPELDKAYPGSKFILTVRESGSWLRSQENHHKQIHHPVFEVFLMYGTWWYDEDMFLTKYVLHNAEVRDYFKDRPEDLLVMNICRGDGWEKLCPFLGVPAPATKFPHEYKGSYQQ